jgi:hypothetical protein
MRIGVVFASPVSSVGACEAGILHPESSRERKTKLTMTGLNFFVIEPTPSQVEKLFDKILIF